MRTILDRLMARVYWRIQGRIKHTFVASCRVSCKTAIGKYCWIREGAEVCRNVTIGDYSYVIGPDTYIEEAIIGKFCSIGRKVIIGPSEHNYNWVSTHPFICSKFYTFVQRDKPSSQKSAPVIGNDVWIGVNSVILRGTRIGHGAVVAAGAVVTHDVHPYSIVAGIPARHIKYRFPEHIRKALLDMQWWDWSDDRLKEALPFFYEVDEFLARYGGAMRPPAAKTAEDVMLCDQRGGTARRVGRASC